MTEYASNNEFFQALRNIIVQVDQDSPAAAKELREGFACLNGLTDGWALLMESIDKTLSKYSSDLKKSNRNELSKMLKVVKKVVYRE